MQELQFTIDTNDVSIHGVRRVQMNPDFYPVLTLSIHGVRSIG